MGHNISAIILKGAYDEPQSQAFDLLGVELGHDLTLFPINHYYAACWQAKLRTQGVLDINGVDYRLYPRKMALAELVGLISLQEEPMYAIIATDYFGGTGDQWANVYRNKTLVDRNIRSINQALSRLGVNAEGGMDEFDTVGLSNHRSEPEYLDKYVDLADELGL